MKQEYRTTGVLRKLFFGDALGARLARGGVVALGIRIASLAISFVMFVVLARNMSEDGYGQFAFAFSFATFVAVVAVLGLPILVLRFIPIYQDEGRSLLLKGIVRDSRIAVLLGGITCAILMLLGSLLWNNLGDKTGTVFGTAVLMVAMAVARHQAYAMRAFGNIALALAPQDVLWRVAVIVGVLLSARGDATISASSAINICSLTLIAIVGVQMFAHQSMRPGTFMEAGLETDRGRWARESVGLWAVTILRAAGPNLSVVIVGLMLPPEQTGMFFAALKTATLLSLPLVAGGIVGAPLISRHYGAGQIDEVQKILSYMVIGITIPVLAGLLLIVLFGDWILGFFGPDFIAAHSVMTLIAVGMLVGALSGPTGIIMNMTGHHKQYLEIMIVTQVVALAILPFATYFFGMMGAAAAIVAGMVSWNIWVWRWSRKNISIDPTIYGVVEWLRDRKLRTGSTGEKT